MIDHRMGRNLLIFDGGLTLLTSMRAGDFDPTKLKKEGGWGTLGG